MELGKRFFHFSEVEKFIESFQQEHFIQLYCSNSIKLTSVNYENAMAARKNNPTLGYYSIQYRCIHGGNFASTSSGQRKSSTLRQGCGFTVRFSLSCDGTFLSIKKIDAEHNHEVHKDVYNALPRQRRLNEEEETQVKTLLDMRCNKRLVKQFIKTNMNKVVLLRDLTNIRAKNHKFTSQDLQSVVTYLTSVDEASVDVIADGDEFEGIYFQTLRMKQAFEKYPQIVLLDATYCLNNLNLPLYILMVINGNGQGEVAATFLLAHETEANIKKMLSIFKTHNPSFQSMKTVFTDKDFKERKSLQEELPHVSLKLCMFHTLRTFNRQITTEKMSINSETRKRVLRILQKMIYASNEEMYEQYYNQLLQLNLTKLSEYFNKNWHSIKEEWVVGLMKQEYTLNIVTTNHLECLNQKIKEVVTRNSPIIQFFKDLVTLLDSIYDEAKVKSIQMYTKKSTGPTNGSIEEKYSNLLTPFAYGIIINELSEIQNVDTEQLVNYSTTNTSCQCTFNRNTSLPCRHVLALLKKCGANLYQPDLINNKFKKDDFLMHYTNIPLRGEKENDQSVSIHQSIQKKSTLNKNQKYNAIMQVCQDIALAVSNNYSTQKFEETVNELKLFRDAVRRRKHVSVVMKEEEGEEEEEEEEQQQQQQQQQQRGGGEQAIKRTEEEDHTMRTGVVHEKEAEVQEPVLLETLEEEEGDLIIEEVEEELEYFIEEVEEDPENLVGEVEEENLVGEVEEENLITEGCSNINNLKTLSNINFKSLCVKRIGRPRGSDLTVIGLKRKRKN
ncbi:hypothetical protein M8J77_006720 [Diaphorina citri]|nr:hypothetical protein M8J77_006720 [Diaphorina citri]